MQTPDGNPSHHAAFLARVRTAVFHELGTELVAMAHDAAGALASPEAKRAELELIVRAAADIIEHL